MKASDALKQVMEGQGRSQRSLALGLGVTPQAVANRLSSKAMKVDTLCEMARELGCRVVIEHDEERFEIEG